MKRRLRVVRFVARLLRVPDRELYVSPWRKLHELADRPDRCYVWVLGEGTRRKDREGFLERLLSEHVRRYRREPRALHVVVSEPQDVEEFTPEEVRNWIKPWLHQAEREKSPEPATQLLEG